MARREKLWLERMREEENIGFSKVSFYRTSLFVSRGIFILLSIESIGYVKDGKIDKREKTFAGKTWYCTGDRAFRDADGYYWFVGRADDVISSAGYRIGPFEVESTLKKHPAVLESAVVASPHAERGEIVKAFIILSAEYQGLSPTQLVDLVLELQTVARKESSPYKYPREIE